MRSLQRILRSKTDPRFAAAIFCLAWLVGSIALIIGLHGGSGEMPAIGIFVFACVLWRWAYRLRGRRHHPGDAIGLLALAIWIANLLGAFAFDFHHYLTDFFFWASAATLLILMIAAAPPSILAPRYRRKMKAALRIFS